MWQEPEFRDLTNSHNRNYLGIKVRQGLSRAQDYAALIRRLFNRGDMGLAGYRVCRREVVSTMKHWRAELRRIDAMETP